MVTHLTRIAIIDDDPEVIEDIRGYLLQTIDLDLVSTATNFFDGLELVKLGGFEVLLCDLGLPDGSGIDLVRACAKLYPKVDIVVITVFAEQTKVIDSIKAGARSYLLKDDKLEDCVAAIRETISGGSAISPAIARHLVKMIKPERSETDPADIELFTPRENEILNLLARGFSVNEIADILKNSRHTIATHVKRIYIKLEVNSRGEAVFEATSRGIIDIF